MTRAVALAIALFASNVFPVAASEDAPPAPEAARLQSVVVDVITHKGRDTLTVYADKSAAYVDHSGGTARVKPGTFVPEIGAVLAAGRAALPKIGPWTGPPPPLPAPGWVRVSLLSNRGLSFGQGPISQLSRDRIGGPVFTAAIALVRKIVANPTGT